MELLDCCICRAVVCVLRGYIVRRVYIYIDNENESLTNEVLVRSPVTELVKKCSARLKRSSFGVQFPTSL